MQKYEVTSQLWRFSYAYLDPYSLLRESVIESKMSGDRVVTGGNVMKVTLVSPHQQSSQLVGIPDTYQTLCANRTRSPDTEAEETRLTQENSKCTSEASEAHDPSAGRYPVESRPTK